MAYSRNKVVIGGQDFTNYLKLGFILSALLDERLDSGSLILVNTDRKKLFMPMTSVEVQIKGEDVPHTYFVFRDDLEKQASDERYWQHTLHLLEPTKYAEKIMIPNITFRQPKYGEWPKYTVASAIRHIRQLCPLSDNSANYLFDLGPDVQALDTIIPEITLNQNNLREACAKVFACLSAIPRFYLKNGRMTLTLDYVNDLIAPIKNNGLFSVAKGADGEYWGESVETRLENGTQKYTTVRYPSTSWASMTSTDNAPITTDTLCFHTPFPIYEIDKLEIWTRFVAPSQAGGTFGNTYEKHDITRFVCQKQLWDALPDLKGSNWKTVPTKGSMMYYKVGGQTIENIAVTYSRKGFWENISGRRNPVMNYIAQLLYPDKQGIVWVGPFDVDIPLIMFRIEYKTKLNSTIRVAKDEGTGADTQLFNNQSENLIDMLDYGNMLHGLTNRMALPANTLAKVCKYGEEYRIGQYTPDNLIVTETANQYYNGFIVSVATLNTNFNQISKYVGVDSSVRQVPLPYAQPVARLHYDDFCTISSGPLRPIDYKTDIVVPLEGYGGQKGLTLPMGTEYRGFSMAYGYESLAQYATVEAHGRSVSCRIEVPHDLPMFPQGSQAVIIIGYRGQAQDSCALPAFVELFAKYLRGGE